MAQHHKITGFKAMHPPMFVQSTDPASDPANDVQPFSQWVDTTTGTSLPTGWIWKRRNAGNTGWDTIVDLKTALDLKATLASPTFTGTPTAPTAGGGTNNTQIATTAFVAAAVGSGGAVSSVFGRTGAVVKSGGDYAVADVTGAAPLASPALTGSPTAPTQSPGDNSTKVATTAYVDTAVTGGGIPASTVTTKGDLLAATASATVARVGVGSNGQALIARSGATPGVAWESQIGTILVVIDGGGAAIAAGVKGDLVVDFDCTILGVTLLADQSGSIVIDVWKDVYGNYPPTVADTITASAKPTLSSAAKSQDTTLTGWTISISAGDTLRFNVDSASTVTRVTLALKIRRS